MLYPNQISEYAKHFKRTSASAQLEKVREEANQVLARKLGDNFKINHICNSICKLRAWTISPIVVNGFEYTGRTLVVFGKYDLYQQYKVSKTDDCMIMFHCISALKDLVKSLRNLNKKDCELILKNVRRHETISKITARKKLVGKR